MGTNMKTGMNFKNVLSMIPVLFLAAACSVGVEGGNAPNLPPFKPDTAHKVQGPKLDGSWMSNCEYSYRDASYQTIAMTFADQVITRTTKLYYDYSCTQMKSKKSYPGTFRYLEDKGNQIFEVEYRLDVGNGVTSITGELVKTNGKSLWITNFVIGDAIPSIELVKAASYDDLEN